MNPQSHPHLVGFNWDIGNLLRSHYKHNEYRMLRVPLTVLPRFDCVLASIKEVALQAHAAYAGDSETTRQEVLEEASERPVYNTAILNFEGSLTRPRDHAPVRDR